MKLFIGLLFVQVALVHAQIASAVIQPHIPATAEPRTTAATAPVLGYVMGSTPVEVLPVFATSVSSKLGDPVPVPAGATRIYLPPQQQYSLIEQNNSSSIALWALHRQTTLGSTQEPLAIPGTMNHPDLVTFSPRGESAALYSQSAGTIQLLTHLPAQPALISQVSASQFGSMSHLTISDDAQVLVAQFADGASRSYSPAGNWQMLRSAFTPDALAFVPNSHDLIVSDTTRKTIAMVPLIDESSKSVRIIAEGLEADQIAIAKGSQQLIAASRATGQVWTVDLQSGTVTLKESLSGKGNLSALRDGFTFALINSRSLSTLKVPALALNTGGKN